MKNKNSEDAKRPYHETIMIRLAAAGDETAFARIVEHHQGRVRTLFLRWCGNQAMADDFSQLAFLQCWQKLKSLQNPLSFSGWLRQIALNIWLQHIRRNDALWGAEEYDQQQASAPDHDITTPLDLDRALSFLPNNQRTVLVLHYYEQLTHSEIAAALDMPLGTVKSHLKRGGEQLKNILNDYKMTTQKETAS